MNGYLQSETQRPIGELAHLVVPALADRQALNLHIQPKASAKPFHLTWSKVAPEWDYAILQPQNVAV